MCFKSRKTCMVCDRLVIIGLILFINPFFNVVSTKVNMILVSLFGMTVFLLSMLMTASSLQNLMLPLTTLSHLFNKILPLHQKDLLEPSLVLTFVAPRMVVWNLLNKISLIRSSLLVVYKTNLRNITSLQTPLLLRTPMISAENTTRIIDQLSACLPT